MDFLNLKGKTIVVLGLANRKSVAWHVAQTLEEAGAKVIYVVRSQSRKDSLENLLAEKEVYVCDVEFE
ncbi:MAG: SDR family oxidoreductase, partial [Pirellulaceae bacterium]|nr:SDR family oxidoreductase [Pirellulaceae bacterium]